MNYFYYQLLLIIKLLLFCSKTQRIRNDKISKYDSNPLENIDLENSIQNQEKNEIEPIHKRQLQEDDQGLPIDIYVDWSAIKNVFGSRGENKDNLNINVIDSAINEVKETLKKLINVKNKTEKKLLKINTDLNIYGFDDYNVSLKDPGVVADLIILIRYSNSTEEMSTTLFARPKIIQPDSDTGVDRPEVGIIILDPSFGLTQGSEVNVKEYLKYLFLHEFTHILGFLEPYIRQKLNPISIDINRISSSNTITKMGIASDRVIAYAKKYFNCTKESMQYIELEELSNFEGLTNCHWDARILLGEYMTSEPYFGDQVISEFTLFLLEDLNFYKTNKYTGDLMKFGKNRGCEFLGYNGIVTVPSDCMITKGRDRVPLSYYEFCKDDSQPTCSSGRQSRTYCERSLKTTDVNENPNYFRLLDKDYLWGRKDTDYCPVSDIKDIKDSSKYVGNCKLGNGTYGNLINYDLTINRNYDSLHFDERVGQIYGNNSFCALSSLINVADTTYRENKFKERIRPTCYPMFCSDTSLTIQIGQQYIVCPQGGGVMTVKNFNGFIYCPEYNLICTGTVQCNNMFDCVDKESKANVDLEYIINTTSDGSVIQGNETNDDIENPYDGKGYEISNSSESKCPQNCYQCIKNQQCFDCKGTNYSLQGSREGDEKPIKCVYSTIDPDNGPYYLNERYDYKIGNIIEKVYFDCMDGCERCQDGDTCKKCSPSHKESSGKCEDRVPNCDIYDTESGVERDPQNHDIIIALNECKQCDKGYYCLKINGIDDRKTCYKIDNETYIFKNETENNCYYRCEVNFPGCLACNETNCFECKEGYKYKNGSCEWVLITGSCDIDIKSIEGDLSEKLISGLVTQYTNSERLSISKVNHYINEANDYTITIFMNSSCTEELLKYGYYSIDNDQITEKIKEIKYQNLKELPITVFVAYGAKNYSLMIFNLGYEDITTECIDCKDLTVEIRNNFSSIVNKTLGSYVLDAVKYGEFDVFNESAGEFTTLCRNVSLLGIDAPLYKRKNYFYMHEFSNSYSCRADICYPTEKILKETTASCVCSKPDSLNGDIKVEEFTFYNISSSKGSKVGDAFKVFECVEDTFDSMHLKKNFGFYFSLIVIILQIILFIIYCIAGKPINFSKGTIASSSNPPKRVAMKINADWIKANLLNEHDEEKDIQSKDEIDDEFVMEEFNYNIDKHDTSSYSVDTDLAKKQIGEKNTEKDGLAEKPDGKKKKKILILLPDKTKPEEGSDMIDDDLLPSKDKKQEKKNFFQMYWIILSLKQHIINYFSGFKWLKITESYVPKFIMGIRSLFTVVFVFFVNAMFLSQDYYDKKFTHFNQKYSLVPGYGKIKISGSEKFNYGFSHTAAYAFYTFLIFLIVQLLFGIFVFSVRKELTELFNSKDVLKINSLAKTLKAKYIVYFVIVIVLMIAFFMYLTNFNGVYTGSGNDFGPAGLLSLIFIEIFPFIWSLILAIFRYFGIACQSKVLYGISQVFMF